MKRKTKTNRRVKTRGHATTPANPYYKPVFRWTTHDGREFRPRDMATTHLFNSIKMLYNNTVPPAFRVGEFRRWKDVATWDPEYLQEAMGELASEFESRTDNRDYLDLYREMGSNARFMLGQGRNPLNHLCVLLPA